MIRGKKPLLVVFVIFIVCFVGFGMQAKSSAGYAKRMQELEQMNISSKIDSIKSELEQPTAKSADLQKEEQQVCSEQLACIQTILDSWKNGNWQNRIQNEIRLTELEFQKKKFGVLSWSNAAEMKDKLAFNQALVQWKVPPRDDAQDGVSSVFNLLKDWMFYLVPLCVIFLTSDLIAGERASGSIKLLLQRRKSRTALYIRKLLFGLKWASFTVVGAVMGAFAGGAVFGGVGSLNYPLLLQSPYIQTWRFFLLCLPVLILSLVFYTALGLCLSTLFRSGVVAAVSSTAAVFALVFFGRKTVVAARGNLWQFSPFECGDAFSAAFGKLSVPLKETLTNPVTGQMITINSGTVIDIPTALPIWGSALVLFAGITFFIVVGMRIFRREDLA